MKKTLITLLALTGLAGAADYTWVDFTTTNDATGSNVNKLWCNGFVVTLNADVRLTTSTTLSGTETATDLYSIDNVDYVLLNSVSSSIRDTRSEDGIVLTLVDSKGVVQAISTNSVTSTDQLVTWEFEDTWVSTSEALYFVYTGSSNTRVTLGATLNLTGEQNNSTAGGYDLICAGVNQLKQVTSDESKSLNLIGSNYYAGLQVTSAGYAPVVTIRTSYVPEPATATLSLLALCGLAARRRRK